MGRPQTFDEERVVADAMDLFWERGFEGTSLDALERATGLNRSSLYNTFGGKLQLFTEALDAYRDGPCHLMEQPLREKAGAAALRGYLDVLRAFVTAPGSERGCLMVNAALSPEVDKSARRRVRAHFSGLRKHLRRAYGEALEEASVPGALDPHQGAELLLTLVRGVLTGAASGESSDSLAQSLDAVVKQLRLE